LFFPSEATIARTKNRAITTHSPTVLFVRSELYVVDGVALRQRVLPLPSPHLQELLRIYR